MKKTRSTDPDVQMTRRTWLQGVSVAGLSLPVMPFLPRASAVARSRDPDERGIEVARPIFSVAERDRRWAAVRAIMALPQWDLQPSLPPTPAMKRTCVISPRSAAAPAGPR